MAKKKPSTGQGTFEALRSKKLIPSGYPATKNVHNHFILLECGNTAARCTFRADVCALRQTLDLRQELIVPSEDDWRAAWVAYERGEAGQAGIVDHVSFQLMRRLGLGEAFTNDKHFQAAGSTVLF